MDLAKVNERVAVGFPRYSMNIANLALRPETRDLVIRFAEALAMKLAAAESKYQWTNNWMNPHWKDELIKDLLEHVEKGDPRDVAAYCAFAWHHGWSLSRPARSPETINEIADAQYAWLQSVGWTETNALEDLALICSEIGEAANECRGDQPTEDFGTELADIILRVLGLARKQGVDIQTCIQNKMRLNAERGNRGRKK